MTSKEAGEVSKAVWGGVAGAVATALIGAALAWVPGAWGWLSGMWSAMIVHLRSSSNMPWWMAYSLSAISASAILCMLTQYAAIRRSNRQRTNQLVFKGVLWRWPDISRPFASASSYCLACDTQLVPLQLEDWRGRIDRTEWRCERCHTVELAHEGNPRAMQGQLGREVARRQRRGEWPPAQR